MSLLLDSHAYLWWLTDDARLGASARDAIGDPERTVFVSAATIWELAIKTSLGKLDVGDHDLVSEITTNGFAPLPISPTDAQAAAALPRHHDDPFDRMLAAQSRRRALTLVTRDRQLAAYEITVFPA